MLYGKNVISKSYCCGKLFFFFFFLLLLLLLLLDGGLKYFKEDFKGVAAITTRCPAVIFSWYLIN